MSDKKNTLKKSRLGKKESQKTLSLKPVLIKKGTYGIIANPGINCGSDY